MNLELKSLGKGMGKVARGIDSTLILPSALKVSEWPIGYPYMLGENVAGMTVGGMIASTMITMGGGSLALAIAERPDLTPYLALGAVGGALTNAVSGAYEYGKILRKKRMGELTFSE